MLGGQGAEAGLGLDPRAGALGLLLLPLQQAAALGRVGVAEEAEVAVEGADVAPRSLGGEVRRDALTGSGMLVALGAGGRELGGVLVADAGGLAYGVDGGLGQLGLVEPEELDALTQDVEVLLDLLEGGLGLTDLAQAFVERVL